MYPNQFITFSETIDPQECGMPIPVVFGSNSIAFFVENEDLNEDSSVTFTVVDASGTPFTDGSGNELTDTATLEGYYAPEMFGIYTLGAGHNYRGIFPANIARKFVAPDECFRIRITIHTAYDDYFVYSNLLRRYENEDNTLSLIEYSCGEDTFGLPFTEERPVRMWLPILLNNPSLEQKDEVYEKLSGERVVLYATINEKWEAQTDYIPYEWHKQLVVALSCDRVLINGVQLTKSDKYEINWQNYIKHCNNIKLTKATWKMVANVTHRNSNN